MVFYRCTSKKVRFLALIHIQHVFIKHNNVCNQIITHITKETYSNIDQHEVQLLIQQTGKKHHKDCFCTHCKVTKYKNDHFYVKLDSNMH